MKIISKFKDFYDHKVAKYGIDPVLVFDRRLPSGAEILHSLPKPPAKWEEEYGACAVVSELYIGNLRVYLFATDEKVYTSYDIGQVSGKKSGHFAFQAIRNTAITTGFGITKSKILPIFRRPAATGTA